MWTDENRGRYDRSSLRYTSDLTDAEWGLVEGLIAPGKRGGRWRTVDLREVVNGLMYVLSTGCQWRAVPKDLPARNTLHDYLGLWQWDGTLDRLHHAPYIAWNAPSIGAGCLPAVKRLALAAAMLAHRGTGQVQITRDRADALLADQMTTTDLGNHIHGQHPRFPSAKAG